MGSAMLTRNTRVPPAKVTLAYRVIGEAKTHVFTSEDVPGLHIGSHSLEKAFNEAVAAVGELISHMCGCHVVYQPAVSFRDFVARLEKHDLSAGERLSSKFVVVNRAEQPARELAHAE
jgi:hypothetical protein